MLLASNWTFMGSNGYSRSKLPTQVAAVCYRLRGGSVEFLLVNTNGSGKWTFPKGCTHPRLSHSEAAAREALEEAGAIGNIESRHFHIYLHSKGVFWKPPGVQEFLVKAYLFQVTEVHPPVESHRNPTWFPSIAAKQALAAGREVKYRHELEAAVDRATERIQA